jgi:organic hydroperoxide reductase OsmC/OhrA
MTAISHLWIGMFVMETESITTLDQVKDYSFSVTFDKKSLKGLVVDEAAPLGADQGPNPSRLLATAIGHCLSSSLLFCLQKSRIPVKHITTKVQTTLGRNETGRWRVQTMGVNITAEPENTQDRDRMKRCLDVFEDFCIVTQSVRKGIEVQVAVD